MQDIKTASFKSDSKTIPLSLKIFELFALFAALGRRDTATLSLELDDGGKITFLSDGTVVSFLMSPKKE